MKNVTGSLAQQGLHTGFEMVQLFIGDKCLDGAGKAAAMDTDGS